MFIKKYKFLFIGVIILVLIIIIVFTTQQSTAKRRLLSRYTLPVSSSCGAGAVAMKPTFKLSPALFGYDFTLENSEHMLVKGFIGFTGNVQEKSTESIRCELQ